MIKLLGSRGMSAVMGLVMLAVGSSAGAQNLPGLGVSAAVQALDANAAAKPLGSATQSVTQILAKPAVAATTAVATATGTVLQSQPAQAVTLSLTSSVATEAAWLYKNGWPLYALVDKYRTRVPRLTSRAIASPRPSISRRAANPWKVSSPLPAS